MCFRMFFLHSQRYTTLLYSLKILADSQKHFNIDSVEKATFFFFFNPSMPEQCSESGFNVQKRDSFLFLVMSLLELDSASSW